MAPYLSKLQKVGLALALLSATEINYKTKKKRIWMKQRFKKRQSLSHLPLMNLQDFDDLNNILKMEKETFYELLELVRPLITKKDTYYRRAVTAEERLLVTLRYLATGSSYRSDLGNSSTISHQLLSKIIPETCQAIYKVLRDTIKIPTSEEEWKDSAQLFNEHWNLNNCVGCVDGRHILVAKPPGSGSKFHNYKGTFSVVLFTVINANHEFMYVHSGINGSKDEGVINETEFYNKLVNKEFNFPEDYKLPDTDVSVPYVFLGNSSFALENHIMTPYPETNISKKQRIFNDRLYRANRIVENTFGILSSRFGVFKQPMLISVDKIDSVVLASCALHNFLRRKSKTYMSPTCIDRDVENGTNISGSCLTPIQNNMYPPSNDGTKVRNTLMEYFNGVGSVNFQDKMAVR